MKYLLLTGIAVLIIAFEAFPALAHHVLLSEFDPNRVVKLTGVVTLIAHMNPHSLIFVDVKNDKGEVEHWVLETLSARQLEAYGIGTSGILKIGDAVDVCGFATKDGVDAMKSFQAPEPISLSLKSIPRPIYTGRLMSPKAMFLSESKKRILGQVSCDE